MNLVIEIKPTMTFANYREIAAREYLKYTLQRASGSIVRAAQLADMNRTHLHEWLVKVDLLDYARSLREVAVDLKHAASQSPQAVTRVLLGRR